MGKTSEQTLLTNLRLVFTTRFSVSELRTLCFDLKVDYDSLPGETKADKARELVAYCERHNSIHELVEVGRQNRPDIHWDSLSNEFSSTSLSGREQTPYALLGLIAVVIGGLFIIIMMLPKPAGDAQVNATPTTFVAPTLNSDAPTAAVPTVSSTAPIIDEVSPTVVMPTAGSTAATNDNASPTVVVTKAGVAAPTIKTASPTAVKPRKGSATPTLKNVAPAVVVTKAGSAAPAINNVSSVAITPTAAENSYTEVEIKIAPTVRDPGRLVIRDEHGTEVLAVSFTPGTQQVIKLPPGNYTCELQFDRVHEDPTVSANCANCTPIPIFPVLPSYLRGYFSLPENVSTGTVFVTDFYVLFSPVSSR